MEVASILNSVQEDLRKVEEALQETARVEYPPLAYALALTLTTGGKRLRPGLVLLSAKFGEYNLAKLLPTATSIELLHSATLVHDDTIDNSSMRRGNPTVNSILSSGATILVGDYLFAQSAVFGAKPGDPRVTAILAQVLADICDGELRQIFDARRWQQSREEYHRRIYCKTAALFAASTELGSVVSGLSAEIVNALRNYGLQLGMAFQIVDDIFDVQGDAREIGKPVGSDLRQGTVTLPTILFLESSSMDRASKTLVKEIIEGRTDREEHVQEALNLISMSGVVETALEEAAHFVHQAKEALGILPDNEHRQSLVDLADYVLERTK